MLACAAPVCDDFLKRVGKKPAHVEFIGCEATHDAQVPVLRAQYRVAGLHAAQVERYFAGTAKMAPLRFACCGWENGMPATGARHGKFPSGEAFPYEVAMNSGETIISRRGDWAKIPHFHVTVTLPLESP